MSCRRASRPWPDPGRWCIVSVVKTDRGLPLVTGAVLAVFTLVGCSGSGRSEDGSTPSAVRTSVLASAPSGVATTAAAGARLAVGGVGDLGAVTLRVEQVAVRDRDQQTGGPASRRVGAFVNACVKANAGAPVAFTLGAWSVMNEQDQKSYPAVSDSWEVAASGDAPIQGQLTDPGSCLTSWIIFDVPATASVSSVTYANAQRDQLVWTTTGP